MRNRIRAAIMAAIMVPMFGCATIVNGTTQSVHFESLPPGATATVGGASLTTPGNLSLKRRNTYDVTFEKPGYVPARRHIGRKTSGAVYGNILLGGLIGMLIDSGTGGMYNLDPTWVEATLVADPRASSAGGPSAPEATRREAAASAAQPLPVRPDVPPGS